MNRVIKRFVVGGLMSLVVSAGSVSNSNANHMGFPDCNKPPNSSDCTFNVLGGVKYCLYEKFGWYPSWGRFCDGEPNFTGWHWDYKNGWRYGKHGANCSYFLSHPEEAHREY